MDLFVDQKLNLNAFDRGILLGTRDLNEVLAAALYSQSPNVQCTHFLIALAKIKDGVTRNALERLGLSLENWESGLSRTSERSANAVPPAHLTEKALHPDTRTMLLRAVQVCAEKKADRISEAVLLLCALRSLPAAVLQLFRTAKIDVDQWCLGLEESLKPVVAVKPFPADTGPLNMKAFTTGASNALGLMRREAESFGSEHADARHLLLALVEREKGVTQYGLFHQGITPRKLQEAIAISLRSGGRKQRSSVPLDIAHIQPLLQRIFEVAGEVAGREHAERISEPHLLQAFLAIASAARNILEDEKVNILAMRKTAESYDQPDDEHGEDTMSDINTVKERLQARLVGQNEAIEQILPYVQRMRFGFTTPGRPSGTFLFCGQSGSGKTEMAKALAKAIYGSEENLVFLEMGQFNSPESMNIFVGAPPGYIGYGEGKLTNGLRDKPRSVVLFDEVEKAHPKVLDALLRFLDEGKIDDPAGPVRDGSQCLLILTSNLGAEHLSKMRLEIEKNPNKQALIRKALRDEFQKHNFRIEFLNRIDELILFRTLTLDDYVDIARRLLERDLRRLAKEREIHIAYDEEVPKAIGAYCQAVSEGARQAHRLVQKVVITPAIDFVLRNSLSSSVRLRVKAKVDAGQKDSEPRGEVEAAQA